ncbi:MAG: protein-disulfide reductase DsbD domain-containing protein [Pseudomonadota bacterium]
MNFRALLFTTTLLTAPIATLAQDMVELDVLPGWREADGTHMAALRVTLDPGWKTYWRAPGDAGIPPRFDWRGANNMQAVSFHWPVPDVYMTNGMRTIGYENQVIIPMQITPQSSGDILMRGSVQIGVCEEICVPVTLNFDEALPSVGAPDSAIQAALSDRPHSESEASVAAVTCAVDPISDGLRITASIAMPALGRGEVAVFETADPTIWISEASTRRDGNTLTASADMVSPSGQPFALKRSDVRITVLSAGQAVDIRGCEAG